MNTDTLKREARAASPWREDIPRKRHQDLTLDAASYNRWIDEIMPWTKDMPATDLTKANGLLVREFPGVVKIGAYHFVVLEVPTHTAQMSRFGVTPNVRFGLELDRHGRDRAYFTGPVRVPALYDCMQRVWMSMTPMEVLTQRPGLKRARGRVGDSRSRA